MDRELKYLEHPCSLTEEVKSLFNVECQIQLKTQAQKLLFDKYDNEIYTMMKYIQMLDIRTLKTCST